jgi:Nickel responsive protein SCO4226-like
MAPIVVEREFARPYDADEWNRRVHSGEWCMGRYGVKPRRHYFAVDGSRVACIFEGPDAEAVRNVGRAAGINLPKHLWTATVELGRDPDADSAPTLTEAGYSLVIVERSFPEPVVFSEVQALEVAGRSCLEMRGIAFLRSYFSLDGRRMLCLYAAPDAESVRVANRQSRLPFDAAWPARILDG